MRVELAGVLDVGTLGIAEADGVGAKMQCLPNLVAEERLRVRVEQAHGRQPVGQLNGPERNARVAPSGVDVSTESRNARRSR